MTHRLPFIEINPDLLQEEMSAAFPGYRHMTILAGEWIEFVFNEGDDTTREAVETLLKVHDPAKLTYQQRLQKERAEAFARLLALDMDAVAARLMAAGDSDFRREILAFMRDFRALLFVGGN